MHSHYKFSARAGLIAAAALGFAAAPALAQSAQHDMLFDAQTQASGNCPAMAWHVVMHPDKTLNGMVSWDHQKHMAHLNGTVDNNGAFKANAVEDGSNKTDTVTGTVHGKEMRATINGTGTGC